MFLKKLEIHGFKSFADKTELLFEPGITAVVGPNGCGKTNVADSVRWVLGEQSAKGLRANEMSDVIFNGTDTRKSASFAEVTLVLSNEDKALPLGFEEISLSRRVYRSNESEYLINKVPARLKDVRDLLMGTGLGTSAYSVMEQGKMDQIVTAKPVERRAIFEEAAGITKYKTRKAEALRKLDATEQNLVRISDIVAEIKRQISSLERQAKQAEKYREHKENLAKLQIQIHLDKSGKLKEKLKETHHKMGQVKGRLGEAQEGARGVEAEEKGQRLLLAEMDQELSALREQAYKVNSETEVLQGRAEGTRQHRRMLSDQMKRNERQVAEALEQIERLKTWVAERLASAASKEGQRTEKTARKTELEARIAALEGDLSAGSQTLENQNAEDLGLLTRAAQMKAELESLRGQDEETSRRMADLRAQLENLSGKTGEARQRLEILQSEKQTAQGREAEESEAILRLQAQLSENETRMEETGRQIQRLNNQVSEIRSRYSVLEELQNKLTGYDSAVKSILQAKQTEPLMWQGVWGVVADLISVDKQHEAAVESLLGPHLQSLVVQSWTDARKVVEFLKSEGHGKVLMLVLDDLARRPATAMSEGALAEGQAVLSHLKFDPPLEPLVRALFEQDILVSDGADMERLSGSNPQARFVSSEGDRGGPLGFIKAGSPTSGVSLLGRHREMVELSEKMRQAEAELQGSENLLSESKKARKADEDGLLAREGERQRLKIRLAELEKEVEQNRETVARLEGEETAQRGEMGELEADWNADKSRIQELEGLLAQSERAHLTTQEQITRARERLRELQTQKEEVSRQAMQTELELSALEEVAARAKEEAERYQKEQEQLTQSVEQKKQENQQLDLEEQQLSLDLADLEKKTEGLSKGRLEADEKVRAMADKRDKFAGAMEGVSEKVRDARTRMEEIQRELHALELQEAQSDVEIRNIDEKLEVEYKVDLSNPPVAVGEDFDPQDAERECVDLRAKIERLGLVNMVAVEEYDELSQRFKFLTEQREDLLRAKEDLQKAIHKINLTSKELFNSTFATVQENFKDIFQRLFEGGRAELILIDEGDVLESGIEIVARPPGKRLQSVSLLSGGEKALTAIALLFALFMVKPSPFCLLDEIDAPLDDVNVTRFTHLLKEFSKRTQFVMITHNKLSMETAEVLYGVTMQESGVSKIISTKFRENAPQESPVS